MIPLVLAGCTAALTSDGGGVSVSFPAAHDIAEHMVVTGTHLCPDTVLETDGGAVVTDCYTFGGDAGAWEVDARCLVPRSTGETTLRLRPAECDADHEAVEDGVTVDALTAGEVDAGVQWLEELATDPTVLLTEPLPEGMVPADGAPIRVAPGGTVLLTPELRRRDDGRRVGWSDGELAVSVEGQGVTVEKVTGASGIGGQVWVEVAEGADATISINLVAAGTWTMTRIVAATPPFTIAQVVPAVLVSEDGSSQPLGARAVVRDAAGELVFGAPVTWSSRVFTLSTGVEDGLPSADYVTLADNCRDPAELDGEQHAAVTATLTGTDTTAVVTWSPPADSADEWSAPAGCPVDTTEAGAAGCGCTSTSPTSPASPSGAWPGLVAFALGWLRARARPEV